MLLGAFVCLLSCFSETKRRGVSKGEKERRGGEGGERWRRRRRRKVKEDKMKGEKQENPEEKKFEGDYLLWKCTCHFWLLVPPAQQCVSDKTWERRTRGREHEERKPRKGETRRKNENKRARGRRERQ